MRYYNIIVLLLLFCRTLIVTCGYRGTRGTVIIIKKLTLNQRRLEILTAPMVTKSKGFCAVTIRRILLPIDITRSIIILLQYFNNDNM